MKQGGADLPVDRTTRERETMATQKRPQQGQQKGGQRPGAMTMAMGGTTLVGLSVLAMRHVLQRRLGVPLRLH